MSKSAGAPRRRWPLFALALTTSGILGVALGLGAFTFVYAHGSAYLSDDPQACANCHVMRAQLDAWRKSSHHAVAVCNDCHAPRGLRKYVTKAVNGFHHSLAFTTGNFHEPIQITARNREITEQQCRRCHEMTVSAMDVHGSAGDRLCTSCHASVGHRTLD